MRAVIHLLCTGRVPWPIERSISKRLTSSDGISKDREARRGQGVLPLHLATERARGRDAHGSFPRDCSGSLTVASKTRLRCSDALASARHPQNYYLQGCEPGWIIFAIEERSYKLSLRGMT